MNSATVFVSLEKVHAFLGRMPTPSDLDLMAKANTFLSREDCMLYETHGTFRNVDIKFLPGAE